MALSWIEKAFYRSLTTAAILEKEGTPFEDWFTNLGGRCWGTDFEPIRPQGRHGDLKCDGHRVSTGTIFQCYAPARVTRIAVEDKIEEDFHGALSVWRSAMKCWSIVINDRAGLQALAAAKVHGLRVNHPTIPIEIIGPIQIEKLVFGLDTDDLGELFGVSFKQDDLAGVRIKFSDIASVASTLGGVDPIPSLRSLAIPTQDKADHNRLDEEIVALLKKGQVLVDRVDKYFSDTSNVEQGERIGAKLSEAFQDMQAGGYDATQIFYELVSACGISMTDPASKRMAGLAIIAYYFNRCDIYENPKVAAA